ncbi:MAG: GTPase Era [Eubacteriales bacterium]|nr:GTPase Era [Eubacteriales bacterium]
MDIKGNATERTAMITVCGRPNVGKSTLTNALVGEKIAITSSKPQTTRNRITGIALHNGIQFILLDTPGFIKPRNRLGDYMVGVVRESVADVDCVLFLVEPKEEVGPGEKALIEHFKQAGAPVILVINKIDTIREKEKLLAVIAAYSAEYEFDSVVPISAMSGEGIDELLGEMEKYAAESPHLFPDDMITDQPERQICAELVREKILRCLDKEIPHGTAVEITKFSERESGIIDIDATIYTEKQSHKGIIIGKNGAMLRKIGADAREEMEEFLGQKVFLQTWVKVKENWRDSEVQLRNFGFRNE